MEQARINSARSEASFANEAGLLLRVARQDWRAFEQLYRDYYPRVTRFVSKMVRQPQLIGEILDDTMLVVWQKADTYNGQSRVSTWIFAIAYLKALKALEREGRHQGDEVPEEAMGNYSADDDPAWSPESSLIALQSRRMVEHLLTQLPPEQRAVVELTYYQGCSYKEIAEIAGCPVDTVKTRMFHARRKLRLMLIQQDPDLDHDPRPR
jgi:RNA polymerase sigma factor (sigma-70 family)